MKLYTEEDIKQVISLSRESYGYDGYKFDEDEIFEELKPIELPSDEEIDNEFAPANEPINEVTYMFIEGAKWMKEQITKQNI